MVYSAFSDDVSTLSQFIRRKAITITTGGTNTPSNYQVKLTITYESGMQVDFDDLRFNTKSRGYIDYWIESYVASTSAIVWVELPDAITDPGSDYIWMYYGNDGLSEGGDVGDTMVFGDDFSTTKSGYVSSGTWNVTGGELVNSGGTWPYYLRNIGAPPYIIFAKMKTTTNNNWWGIVNRETSTYTLQGASGFQPQPYYDAILRRIGGTQNNLSESGLLNTYHNYELFDSGSSGKFLYDGGDEVTINSSVNNSETYVGFGGGITNWGTADYWYVRKYIANEPTPSYGTAQHQRRTPQFIG